MAKSPAEIRFDCMTVALKSGYSVQDPERLKYATDVLTAIVKNVDLPEYPVEPAGDEDEDKDGHPGGNAGSV